MTARIFIATAHIQAHSQAGETTVHAVAPHTHGFRWRTLLVGLMHGVAGPLHCLCLRRPSVLGANSRGRAVHVLLFGIGSMIGMGVPSCVIALPIAISAR